MNAVVRILHLFSLASLALLLAWSLVPAQQAGAATVNSAMQEDKLDSRLSAATITGTLVYHEITSLTTDPLRVLGLEAPILSADGNRAVFTIAPGPRPQLSQPHLRN
jgi:hypothetical protein